VEVNAYSRPEIVNVVDTGLDAAAAGTAAASAPKTTKWRASLSILD